jgi:hypothetical protein
LLTIKLQGSPSTPPSTLVATRAKRVVVVVIARHSRRHVATKRSNDLRHVDYVVEPLHARFYFTLEGCSDDEGLHSLGDLPHCSPSKFVLKRYLSGESMFFNPPWELTEHVARHFESCRRTTPTSTMVVFVLPQWAKFNDLIRYRKLYQTFHDIRQLLTR